LLTLRLISSTSMANGTWALTKSRQAPHGTPHRLRKASPKTLPLCRRLERSPKGEATDRLPLLCPFFTVENKSQKSGVFFALRFAASSNHVKTTNHHVLTIQKPRSAHPYLQDPPQKRPSTMQTQATYLPQTPVILSAVEEPVLSAVEGKSAVALALATIVLHLFFAFFAPKTHVKSINHLTHYQSTISEWRMSYLQTAILNIENKTRKAPDLRLSPIRR
jgi:hypothetical protein